MVKILHLYYDLMNLYGEYGNIEVLCRNLDKNGIGYEVSRYTIGDTFEFDDFDFIYCGSGTENKTNLAIKDFVNRKESFNKAFLNNKIILFTGSSISLLGKECVGFFNYSISNSLKRISGDVICECETIKDIVGYVNTSYVINSFEEKTINITHSDIELKNNPIIGYTKNNLLTINITGPILIKNPHLLKDYLNKLGANNIDTISKNQYLSYSITLEKLKNRFN